MYNCPFCPCVFVTQQDFQAHIKAFQDRNTPPNKMDHQLLKEKRHNQIEHEAYDQ